MSKKITKQGLKKIKRCEFIFFKRKFKIHLDLLMIYCIAQTINCYVLKKLMAINLSDISFYYKKNHSQILKNTKMDLRLSQQYLSRIIRHRQNNLFEYLVWFN